MPRPSLPLALVLLVSSTPAAAEPWDGPDKRAHLVAGAGIAATGSVLAHALDLGAPDRALVGFALGAGAGALKEGLDALGLGTASAPDLVWTVAGSALGATLTLLLAALIGD